MSLTDGIMQKLGRQDSHKQVLAKAKPLAGKPVKNNDKASSADQPFLTQAIELTTLGQKSLRERVKTAQIRHDKSVELFKAEEIKTIDEQVKVAKQKAFSSLKNFKAYLSLLVASWNAKLNDYDLIKIKLKQEEVHSLIEEFNSQCSSETADKNELKEIFIELIKFTQGSPIVVDLNIMNTFLEIINNHAELKTPKLILELVKCARNTAFAYHRILAGEFIKLINNNSQLQTPELVLEITQWIKSKNDLIVNKSEAEILVQIIDNNEQLQNSEILKEIVVVMGHTSIYHTNKQDGSYTRLADPGVFSIIRNLKTQKFRNQLIINYLVLVKKNKPAAFTALRILMLSLLNGWAQDSSNKDELSKIFIDLIKVAQENHSVVNTELMSHFLYALNQHDALKTPEVMLELLKYAKDTDLSYQAELAGEFVKLLNNNKQLQTPEMILEVLKWIKVKPDIVINAYEMQILLSIIENNEQLQAEEIASEASKVLINNCNLYQYVAETGNFTKLSNPGVLTIISNIKNQKFKNQLIRNYFVYVKQYYNIPQKFVAVSSLFKELYQDAADKEELSKILVDLIKFAQDNHSNHRVVNNKVMNNFLALINSHEELRTPEVMLELLKYAKNTDLSYQAELAGEFIKLLDNNKQLQVTELMLELLKWAKVTKPRIVDESRMQILVSIIDNNEQLQTKELISEISWVVGYQCSLFKRDEFDKFSHLSNPGFLTIIRNVRNQELKHQLIMTKFVSIDEKNKARFIALRFLILTLFKDSSEINTDNPHNPFFSLQDRELINDIYRKKGMASIFSSDPYYLLLDLSKPKVIGKEQIKEFFKVQLLEHAHTNRQRRMISSIYGEEVQKIKKPVNAQAFKEDFMKLMHYLNDVNHTATSEDSSILNFYRECFLEVFDTAKLSSDFSVEEQTLIKAVYAKFKTASPINLY